MEAQSFLQFFLNFFALKISGKFLKQIRIFFIFLRSLMASRASGLRALIISKIFPVNFYGPDQKNPAPNPLPYAENNPP
jgi:hypothetical protein